MPGPELEATSWRVSNMRRCPHDHERWIADVVYSYDPTWFSRWLLRRYPRQWIRTVRSGRQGAWYWMPEVRRLRHADINIGMYVVENHEWDLNMALDRERDEALEREHVDRITFETARTTLHVMRGSARSGTKEEDDDNGLE